MSNELFWQTKLAARLHDPAEKALVLLRDPAGHEGGTSRSLIRLLGLSEIAADNIDPDNSEALSTVVFKKGLPISIYRHVQRADWWAAAADRPQWPMQEITVTTQGGEKKALKVADWAQVRWAQKPVLIHPLSGTQYELRGDLSGTDIGDIKQRSFDHFSSLLAALGAKDDLSQDMRKTLLAFWRFGPELVEEADFGKLGQLWRLLPTDTRVPDHSIWDHLDLTSAFAGAFAADPGGEVALLALSIGPVQSFIAAARKTEDLWAGSHLLSRLAWEAMKPLCEDLGPDAILFPRLRGIPQVDVWLRDPVDRGGCGLPAHLFEDCDWMGGGTDANPLFSAALPNRFVAVVPVSQVRTLAVEATRRVREWLLALGYDVVDRLLEEAEFKQKSASRDESVHAYQQMRKQLEGFPEVHWAAVPFSLICPRDVAKQTDLDVTQLCEAMAPFFGVGGGQPCGFLKTPAWKTLQAEIDWDDNTTFFAPNPGVLYPAVYDLGERLLAAAKSVRGFDQTEQKGWRCSLTGETEWLTTEREQLKKSYRQQTDTLWARVAAKRPAWARKGEHLGALPAIKRLWPTLFADEVSSATGKEIGRFVVSTHTMALATNLERFHECLSAGDSARRFRDLVRDDDKAPALPPSLAKLRGSLAARIPAALDRLRESDERADEERLGRLESEIKAVLGFKPETYYALLLMDGDRMGRILSGDDDATAITYRESFHPQVRKGFDQHAQRQDLVHRYGEQKRTLSPNRHLAISGALNDFSQIVVRHVVEEEHLGRVIYAGGDDVLAMLPVADLLSAIQRLRHAYSGHDPEHEGGVFQGLTLRDGFAALKSRRGGTERIQLMRMMGTSATASAGAVIAHHQAPLGAVMRELRAAEQRAKKEGGRDAFSITAIKRSGGTLRLTEKWGKPVALLCDLRKFLADPGVSRRAVYNSLEWLTDLPEPQGDGAMLKSLLAYQLGRQAEKTARDRVPGLAQRLTELTVAQSKNRLRWLSNFLNVAEFLARETRAGESA
ncbi:MAG: type III-B CRISPR-associated protein Cas10/Cmr2 [Burkholderiales bacterium]|nr:type III-B CRISPR-associated protein Cas10/Cmr2 [Burkholderiales bacterium]